MGVVLDSLAPHGNALGFFVLGVLPHGIIEIPAFFLAAAFGLKFGYHIIFPMPQKSRGEGLVLIWKEFWALFPLIVAMLLLSAGIEIILTPVLVGLS